MSEIADQNAFNRAVDASLLALEAKVEAQDSKLSEHDRALAEIDSMEKHLVALIEGLRDQVIEGFRRMRLGVNGR